MKKILQFKLKLLARLYVWRYRPRVIGITGSVGKTSVKEAIGLVLKDKFKIRISAKSYNNQIGFPLTILGFETAGRNILGWLVIFLKALGKIIYDPNHPQILVLEMGSDKISDLNYLVSIVKPDIAVITNVGPVHLQAFKDLKGVAKEKSVLVKNIKKNGWAVLNYDDEYVRAMANKTNAKKIFYGLSQSAEVRADKIKIIDKNLIFNIHINNQLYNFHLRGIGEHLVYTILAAFSVAEILKIESKHIIASLTRFQPLPGRGRFLEGENNNLIIDESYNASPMSVAGALKFLEKIKTNKQKVVILGDMRELGEKSFEFHQDLAAKISFANKIILVGSEIKGTYDKILNKTKNIFYFKNAEELDKKLSQLIKSDNLVLVKGSQAIRLEKIVAKLISSRYNKREVLVRQDNEWQNK
ncbi:MAG: UDP-N-acetylmuramoyl-tripeptide--D-alanyl-D-alanine ligase [Patescibacteria group bacterium]|nr:UDP-N-acetylmuramoyl-tripeptide--D-alanyl-D-alanine ligase [Patescibacteria group bacterium]